MAAQLEQVCVRRKKERKNKTVTGNKRCSLASGFPTQSCTDAHIVNSENYDAARLLLFLQTLIMWHLLCIPQQAAEYKSPFF